MFARNSISLSKVNEAGPVRRWTASAPGHGVHAAAIHGAAANTSGQRRTGVALRYMPSTSVFERDLRPVDGQTGVPVNFARRPIWLLRGVDRSGRNDFSVGHRR